MSNSWLRRVGQVSLLWAGMVLAAWPILAQTSNQANPEKPPAQRAPVVVGGKTLFYVQERVYSFSPEDRAKAITERVQRLYRDPKVSLDAIRVEDQETATEVAAGDMVIMTVTDRDAKAAGRGRQELANQ